MLELLREMFSYGFLVRALAVGTLIALCAALLGVTLVLKRYSMIGDGLSHVGFGALTVAAAMNLAPLQVALPVVVLAAFLLLRLNETGKIKSDAGIALISTTALAIGVVVASQTTGLNSDLNSYMFGSILVLDGDDVVVSIVLSLAVLVFFVLFYHRIFAVTFDEDFARATGTRAGAMNLLIALLTAVTVVLGMRMMGTLLISGIVLFPTLSARRVCRRFSSLVVTAAIISVVCFVVGLILSYLVSTPVGATVILVNLAVLAVFSAVGALRARLQREA